MEKHFLTIVVVLSLILGCSTSNDDPGSSQIKESSVTIDAIAADDIIDDSEANLFSQTVSGTATGGYITTGDAVEVKVNGEIYRTIVSEGVYSVEVATSDLIADNKITVIVTSTGDTGNNLVKVATKVITVDVSVISKVFAHPGLLVTNADFDRIKTKVDASAEPWLSGWNKLITNSHAQTGYNPNPLTILIRGGNSAEEPNPDNYGAAFNDAAAAFQLAIRWKVTGDNAYADKSIEILNAWASTCTKISGNSNVALAAGIYGYQFANAAEIMRDYEGWAESDFEKYKQWMVDVFYSISKDFLGNHFGTCDSHYWANWDLVNIANVIAISVLTDDQDMYNSAIKYLKTGVGNGNLNHAIYYIHNVDGEELGQLQESGRDQGHSLLCVGYLGEIARMALNQGDDLFAYDDNRILKGAEYAAKYNVANIAVPFEEYTRRYKDAWTVCGGTEVHTEISSQGRGEIRPIWELLYNHYVVKKGLSAPYIKLAADTYRAEGGGGDYGPNSGGYDSLGLGTLLYSE